MCAIVNYDVYARTAGALYAGSDYICKTAIHFAATQIHFAVTDKYISPPHTNIHPPRQLCLLRTKQLKEIEFHIQGQHTK